MRKLFVLLVALVLLSGQAWGAMPYVTSNTVSFSTTGIVVTFNTVINKILVVNGSASEVVQVQFDGSKLGWNEDKTVYTLPNLNNSFRLEPSSSISVDVSTEKIGIIGRGANAGTIQWLATSERRVSDNTLSLINS